MVLAAPKAACSRWILTDSGEAFVEGLRRNYSLSSHLELQPVEVPKPETSVLYIRASWSARFVRLFEHAAEEAEDFVGLISRFIVAVGLPQIRSRGEKF